MDNLTAFERVHLSRQIAQADRVSAIQALFRRATVLALAGLLAILAIRAAYPVLSAAPAPMPKIVDARGHEVSLTSLCAQYRSDHLMTGDPMAREMREMCDY